MIFGILNPMIGGGQLDLILFYTVGLFKKVSEFRIHLFVTGVHKDMSKLDKINMVTQRCLIKLRDHIMKNLDTFKLRN